MPYIIKTKIGVFNYFMALMTGKHKTFSYWHGMKNEAKQFTKKKDAEDFAFAETTMSFEIILV